MKKRLNVIDLDHTLISKDSLRLFVFMFLKRKDYFFPVIRLIMLRFFGSINPAEFLKRLLVVVRKERQYDRLLRDFSERLFKLIDQDVYEQVINRTDDHTINVLCTASPSDYVIYLAGKLNWNYIASTFDDGNTIFTRMYGSAKIDAILNRYPKEMFDYSFAISDHESDLSLLRLFNEYVVKK